MQRHHCGDRTRPHRPQTPHYFAAIYLPRARFLCHSRARSSDYQCATGRCSLAAAAKPTAAVALAAPAVAQPAAAVALAAAAVAL